MITAIIFLYIKYIKTNKEITYRTLLRALCPENKVINNVLESVIGNRDF